MSIPVLPVANGAMPRVGGEITGVFLDSWTKRVFRARRGSPVLLLPFSGSTGLYPVGTAVAIEESWAQQVIAAPSLKVIEALFARVTGKATVKAGGFHSADGILFAANPEVIDLAELRSTYPVIDGAGWRALQGSTEARGRHDIRVSIYGISHGGEEVVLSGNLGDLVDAEEAHTIEHAIIRSLTQYAMVTPKTLRECVRDETEDLKASLEIGYRLKMPEVFGVTATGACGNPLTGLAHFYLADGLRRNLAKGASFTQSLEDARLSALSRVTRDLELTTRRGACTLQGLKKGMMHDDSVPDNDKLRSVLRRFPLSPFA